MSDIVSKEYISGMEALTQHLFPPLVRIVEEYNPPRSLLIIKKPNVDEDLDRDESLLVSDKPRFIQSKIVDSRWESLLDRAKLGSNYSTHSRNIFKERSYI